MPPFFIELRVNGSKKDETTVLNKIEEKEAGTRRTLLAKTQAELDKIIAGTKKTKYSKEIRAGKVVNKYKMGKFIYF